MLQEEPKQNGWAHQIRAESEAQFSWTFPFNRKNQVCLKGIREQSFDFEETELGRKAWWP